MLASEDEWRGPPLKLYVAWVAVCALAEFLGIAVGAAWWVSMDRFDPDPQDFASKAIMLVLKSLSGVGEGIALGGLQALVLRLIYPSLPVFRWIRYTTLLAVFGWAIGSAIPIFVAFSGTADAPFDPPLGPLALASAGLGALLGVLFGLVQRLALVQAASHSRWWVFSNAAGWALALPIIYVAASSGDPDAPVHVFVATGLAAGLAAGSVLGLVTGLSFWRMVPQQ